jgi:hypothetical protein
VLRAETDAAFKRVQELEQQYEQEEDEMLMRLMRVRRSLWT